MKVLIPSNNINERKYIIDILLKEFLGLKYSLEITDAKNYEIILKNGKKLIIEDYFFNWFPKDLEYLNKKNIPIKVKFGKNDFIVEDDIPIIYGIDKLIDNYKLLITGIDIFASSYFMLTRWEEYVNKVRDKHNRFPYNESLAYKNAFLNRPVVNEYVEMLWNMLKFLGCKQKRKENEFQFIITHDIDVGFNHKYFFKAVLDDLIHFNFLGILKRFKRFSLKEKFDTYDFLMDISEFLKTKSYFFLHSSMFNKRYDENNFIFLKSIVRKIVKRGHFIGCHPSYNAYNDLEVFLKNKKKIENFVNANLNVGRMHYLRVDIPNTWQIWEDAKMEWDSSLGYACKNGFRCGVCNSFSVFNFINREKLNLKEKPLIFMETNLLHDVKFLQKEISFLKEKVKKYKGEFVFLWHNSNVFGYENVYKKVLND